MEQVKIIVKNGKVTIDFQGYTTNRCITDQNKLLELIQQIGLEVEINEQKLKPEAKIPDTEGIGINES